MLHQREKERHVTGGNPLLIERENEVAALGVNQEIGILDALGDALVGQQRAEIVAGQKAREIVGADVGIDRQTYSAA
jgi:hypothetical protein